MNGGQKQNGSPSASSNSSSKHNSSSPGDSKDAKKIKTESASNHQNNRKKISLPEKFLRGPGREIFLKISYLNSNLKESDIISFFESTL